jgi:hypothetical protein
VTGHHQIPVIYRRSPRGLIARHDLGAALDRAALNRAATSRVMIIK